MNIYKTDELISGSHPQGALLKSMSGPDVHIILRCSTISKAYRVFNKKILVVEESIHMKFDKSNHKWFDKKIEDDDNILEDKVIDLNDHISQENEIGNFKNNEKNTR